ncbi:MAG: arylsulfotransferase family protein [Bdellovibrionota bacterium]
MKIFLLLFLIIQVHAAPVEGLSPELSFVDGCKVTANSFRDTKVFPGNRCIFLPDGSFLSASNDTVRLFSPTNSVVWAHKDLWLHHQMNLSADGTRILLLGSEIIALDGKKVRGDIFIILDLKTGKVLHQSSSRSLLIQKNLAVQAMRSNQSKINLNLEMEITHFNSMYEIPAITGKNVPAYIKAGNIIVNSKKDTGFLILSPDLQTVLHHGTFPMAVRSYTHDVQVTPEGNYLIFNNLSMNSTEEHPYSEINEVNPGNMKVMFTIKAEPGPFFFSLFCGGIQKLNERYYFISHNYAGVFFYDKKLKKITMSGDFLTRTEGGVTPTQQVKLLNVSSFLLNHQSN